MPVMLAYEIWWRCVLSASISALRPPEAPLPVNILKAHHAARALDLRSA